MKWNSPFYGVEGKGWFLSFRTFARYVKVAFFKGASLRPLPPGSSKSKDTRYLDIFENDELDENAGRQMDQAGRSPAGLDSAGFRRTPVPSGTLMTGNLFVVRLRVGSR